MTITDNELDDLTFIDDGGLHVLCCMDHGHWSVNGINPSRFLCGVTFHPEMVAPAPLPVDDDDVCPDCTATLVAALCPPSKPTHLHCPLNGRRCPS